MKMAVLLCIAISVGIIFAGCADQNGSTATRASTVNPGVSPGLSASGGGGGGGGPHVPLRTQP